MQIKVGFWVFALFAMFFRTPETWGMYNGDEPESNDSRFTLKKEKTEEEKKREEKVLVLCQGNVPLYTEVLYEIEPAKSLLLQKKSRSYPPPSRCMVMSVM